MLSNFASRSAFGALVMVYWNDPIIQCSIGYIIRVFY